MKNPLILIVVFLLGLYACQPKTPTPITDQLRKVWKANTVTEATVQVFLLGGTNNIKPGYVNFRLDLSQLDKASLTDVDGRLTTGTWTLSTDNKRLILNNLTPAPTNTGGTIEYYILKDPDGNTLNLERTAESRKTGNTVNQYELIPQ